MDQEEIRGLVIGEPSFAGLVGLSNTAFTLRVTFTTLPLKQWTVRFALDTQVKNTSISPEFGRRYKPTRFCRHLRPSRHLRRPQSRRSSHQQSIFRANLAAPEASF
jgi:hypothetical protein